MSASTFVSTAACANARHLTPPVRRASATKRPARPVLRCDALASIEDDLRRCPQVDDVLVTEREDRPLGRRLVAYALASGDAAQVRAQMAMTVEPAMLPSTVITLDAFPRTADGSIDRAALPAPDSRTLGVRQYEAPLDSVEAAIATIWQDLLGVERIGRNAHFFELGGHSTLALRFIHRIRQSMQVGVAMRDLFHEPVLHRFAATVSAQATAGVAMNLNLLE